MRKIKFIYVLILSIVLFQACKDKNTENFDPEKQIKIDDSLINDFITKNKITALKHSSGLYYQILEPGTGNVSYSGTTEVTVNYEGRLLNGSVFDKSSSATTFPLGSLIYGWQVGIPLIQKGGRVRLIIPSNLAYGNRATGGIPANSVLDFTIELINTK
ncbi:MAG: FKBP-type peptidyl-prolyl cis-trans isomerase [Sphingobacteriaceae bacterium]|nr:FKBP-type peptidyl-prolyl cis-trans isomerase [Sphingobacteriaceae bacterium]